MANRRWNKRLPICSEDLFDSDENKQVGKLTPVRDRRISDSSMETLNQRCGGRPYPSGEMGGAGGLAI